MNTFLFTWNPNKFNWSDLPEAIVKVNTSKVYDMSWSCGNAKRISIGDIFFLMRLGVPPKGIIGVGQMLSKPYDLPHWDEEKAKYGKKSCYVDLLYWQLNESPLVDATILQTDKKTKKFNWFPRASGILVPQDIADYILKKIEKQSGSEFNPCRMKALQ